MSNLLRLYSTSVEGLYDTWSYSLFKDAILSVFEIYWHTLQNWLMTTLATYYPIAILYVIRSNAQFVY